MGPTNLHDLPGLLAVLGVALWLWQWAAGRRFPLGRVVTVPGDAPSVSVLKPLNGATEATEACLRSWLVQEHPAEWEVLFGVASEEDPACPIVRRLLDEYPGRGRLIVCSPDQARNPKVAKLIALAAEAGHALLLVSDADVEVSPGFLREMLAHHTASGAGLSCCLYRLHGARGLAQSLEGVANNADFWSQVAQSQSLGPPDFALGAVMLTSREALAGIGGFAAVKDHLADDFQLGHQMRRQGLRISIAPCVVDCRHSGAGWRQILQRQVRWARTMRVCKPLPYFLSLLSNATCWPLLYALSRPTDPSGWGLLCVALVLRVLLGRDLLRRFLDSPAELNAAWLLPLKDLLQVALWLAAHCGRTVWWGGRRYQIDAAGLITKD